MKILCIGDSTSLPGHTNSYEDTWIYYLKKQFPIYDFITIFKRNLTTDILVEWGGGEEETGLPIGADCLEHFQPDKVIIQLGIVDCAPRLINEKSFIWKIIRRMPIFFMNKYIIYLKKNGPRDIKNVLVSATKFRSNINTYLSRCKSNNIKKVIILAIPPPGNEMILKNQTIKTNVTNYNGILQDLTEKYEFTKFLCPFDGYEVDQLYHDGYHPNPKGNKIIAEQLISTLH